MQAQIALALFAGFVCAAMPAAHGNGGQDTAPPGLARTDVRATLRVAVGLDVRIGDGWSVRYSFSESLSGNPISEQLTPPGRRNLANFQNLVGVLRSF